MCSTLLREWNEDLAPSTDRQPVTAIAHAQPQRSAHGQTPPDLAPCRAAKWRSACGFAGRITPGAPLLSAEDLAERGRQEVRSLLATRRQALERQWQRHLAASGIPERFRGKGFTDYQADSAEQVLARSICQDFACALSAGQRPGETLLLLGGPGTGKTHLACAILATLVRAGQRGWYVSLPSALRSLRDARSSRSQGSETEAFAQLSAPDLLVLDDVIDAQDETRSGLLFEVLDARYAQQRATILIGDLPASRLEQTLGPRIIERLHEAGTRQVSLNWPSHRRRAG